MLAAAACLLVTASCTRTISGTPTPEERFASNVVGGLPVHNGPSGPKAGVPNAQLPVEGSDDGPADTLARNAVADIESYWKHAFPRTFNGREFTPVERLVSYDSAGHGAELCDQSTQGLVNAFYCPSDDAIAWDRGELLPMLESSFGPMGVVAVLAHELGHAVEHRAGIASPDEAVIVREQRADCFTGAFFRHVAEDSAEHFRVSTGAGLNEVMGVLNYIRDAPGDSDFTSNNAHGSAFDRVTAFQFGFLDGPGRCTDIDRDEVKERSLQFEFWKQEQETDLPVTESSIRAVEASLREVFKDTGIKPPTIVSEPAPCPGEVSTTPVSYCVANDTVSLDQAALSEVARPPDKDSEGGGYGDFAAYAQVASRYAMSLQNTMGLALEGEQAGLRTACFVGAWSGLLVEDPIGKRNPVGALRVAPGDIDEGVAALLDSEGLIAADLTGEQVPGGFARVEAFRAGFETGISPCASRYAGN